MKKDWTEIDEKYLFNFRTYPKRRKEESFLKILKAPIQTIQIQFPTEFMRILSLTEIQTTQIQFQIKTLFSISAKKKRRRQKLKSTFYFVNSIRGLMV